MTPPTVQFIPAAAATANLVVQNGVIRTFFGGVENTVQADGSSTVYNGWTLGNMFFRDTTKDGVWQNGGLGLLWYMVDATNFANWTGLITGTSGQFLVYYAGTSTLIFSLVWNGQALYTTYNQQYGSSSFTYNGIVAPSNTRCDVFWV